MPSSSVSPGARTLHGVADLVGMSLTPAGDGEVEICGITLDSRDVRPGDLYAALPGARHHGASFAATAVAAGAVAILTDAAGETAACETGRPVLVVPDLRRHLGDVAAWVHGRPSQALRVIGITGTNGKTTTAYLIDAGLRAAGRRTGLIGTVETRIDDEVLASERTTPEAPALQRLLARMRDAGCSDVTMEVSSHALALGRVDATQFAVAAFTNLGRDHLDFHGDLETYFAAKAELFGPERAALAVVDVDGTWGQRLARLARDRGVPVVTVATDPQLAADWRAADVTGDATGSWFRVTGPAVDRVVRVGLPGAFNVGNALVALAVLDAVGAGDTAADGLARVSVPGRMQTVVTGPVTGIVDFAHTPEAVGTAARALRPRSPGRLLVVLGAGGDRDRAKRKAMGAAAAAWADVVVVTDDNPRSEDPAVIRAAVVAGAELDTLDPTATSVGGRRAEVLDVAERRTAIRQAVALARPGDVVAVLGKGHEQGQERNGATVAFDDRVELRAALAASGTAGGGRALRVRVLPDADIGQVRAAMRELVAARDDAGAPGRVDGAPARPGTWAVIGELSGGAARDTGHVLPSIGEQDELGRLAVRLDISALVAVGEPTRPLHLGATLEGSWGGESVCVPDAGAAADLLLAGARVGDLVLVAGRGTGEVAAALLRPELAGGTW